MGLFDAIGGFAGAAVSADVAKRQRELDREAAETQKSQFGQTFGEGQRQFGEQMGLAKEQFGAGQEWKKKAYEQAIGNMGAGEAGLQSSLAQGEPPEVAQARKDALTGQAAGLQQASGQMQAALAQQGVRGGQAATQLRRGLGEMGSSTTMDINRQQADEAMRKRALMQQYQMQKGLMGAQGAQS